jgi:hypothetical protein
MDLSFVFFHVVVAAPLFFLPFLGRKWSAVISYLIFGSLFALGSVVGYLGLTQPPAGNSHDFARMFLILAAIAAAMILITWVVYRFRQRKQNDKSLTISQQALYRPLESASKESATIAQNWAEFWG